MRSISIWNYDKRSTDDKAVFVIIVYLNKATHDFSIEKEKSLIFSPRWSNETKFWFKLTLDLNTTAFSYFKLCDAR